MRIGLVTTTLRQIKNLEDVVRIAAESGVQCIEWGGDVHVTDIGSARLAKKLCDEAGIAVSSYGSYYRVGICDKSEWKRICEISKEIGAEYIRVWLGTQDSEKTDDESYSKLVEDAKSMCAVAAEYGLCVCPECHGGTYNNNTDAFLKIREDIGCDNFKTYFQSRYRRMNYDLDRIERTVPYIQSVHVSFFDQRREQFPKYNPSYMRTLLEKLNEVGYDGDVLLEFTYFSFQHGVPAFCKRDIKKLKKMTKNY